GGGAAAARLQRDGEGDALVEGGGDQGGLAVPRVADHGDALAVELRDGYQVIDRALHAPGPGGDGTPILRLGPREPGLPVDGADPLGGAGAVGFDVAVV